MPSLASDAVSSPPPSQTDDDTYVCVGALLRFLAIKRPLYSGMADHGTHQRPRVSMLGSSNLVDCLTRSPPVCSRVHRSSPLAYHLHGQRVIRRRGHKWSDPLYVDTFGGDGIYFDYMQGVGYTLSAALARTVVHNAAVLRIGLRHGTSIEDAWVGALARFVPPAGTEPSSDPELSADSGPMARLRPNRTLTDELLLPTAQWVDNVSASCASGFILVHKLDHPHDLEVCARVAAQSPPFCHVKQANLAFQSATRVLPDQVDQVTASPVDAGGPSRKAPQRCACDDHRERVERPPMRARRRRLDLTSA